MEQQEIIKQEQVTTEESVYINKGLLERSINNTDLAIKLIEEYTIRIITLQAEVIQLKSEIEKLQAK